MDFFKYYKESGFKEEWKKEDCRCNPINEARFFTPCSFTLGKDASEYLSLLYEPKHELKFQCDLLPPVKGRNISSPWDWEPTQRRDNEHFKGIRRVWAAFGKPGGGWEFTGSGDMGKPFNYRLLPDGGFEEEYSHFVSPIAYEKVQIIRATMVIFMRELIEKQKKRVYIKEVDDSLAWVVYFYTEFEFTISVALREPNTGIRIWGVFWKDNATDRSSDARVLSPLIMITFPDWKITRSKASETIHKMMESAQDEYDPNLLNWLRKIKNHLFSIKCASALIQHGWKRNLLKCPKDWTNYIWRG